MKNMTRKKFKLTEKEEIALQKQIAADEDAQEASDVNLAQAKPFADAFPDLMETIRRGRGRPAVANPRKQISLRLDGDVIDKFKSTGKGWQGRLNDALRKAAGL
jgi:uncharacterized protein (DUF4415 family)